MGRDALPPGYSPCPIGQTAHPHSYAWEQRIGQEDRAQARTMFAQYGRNGESLLWADGTSPLAESKLNASRKSRSLRKSCSTPMPFMKNPITISSYDPSLVQSTIGSRARPGSLDLAHAHSLIGGAADHHTTKFPHLDDATLVEPPATGCSSRNVTTDVAAEQGDQKSLRSVRSSPAASLAASRRTRGSALSAASSVLLKQEVEQAVQQELARLMSL